MAYNPPVRADVAAHFTPRRSAAANSINDQITMTAASVAAALALRAATLRKQAGGRSLAGAAGVERRKAMRDDASRYDAMARKVMNLDNSQLYQLHTLLGVS